MLKAYSLKFISLVMLFSIGSSFAHAESVFTQLPFGIEIGVTKNSEVEKHGGCVTQIKVTASHFRCERYDMSGRFVVYSSEDEIVNAVMFQGKTSNLPKAWQAIGLKIFGTTDIESTPDSSVLKKEKLLSIIENNGGINIAVTVDTKNDFVYHVDFDVENYHYEALYYYYKGQDFGLQNITITESY